MMELIDISDQVAHLRVYVSGLISAFDCPGDPIKREEICALLKPADKELTVLEEDMEGLIDKHRGNCHV